MRTIEHRLVALERRVLDARSINEQREEYFTTEDGRLWKRYARNSLSVIELPCNGRDDDPMEAIIRRLLDGEPIPDDLEPEEVVFWELAVQVRDKY